MTASKFFIGRVVGFILVLILVFAFFALRNKPEITVDKPMVTENIIGCYIATIDKDVYTLNIKSQEGQNFDGTLQFKNFQKDSSSGTYVGTYIDQTLSGTYSFQSEGTDSIITTKFKKFGNDFIRGVDEEGGIIQYDATASTSIFKKGECLTN